MVQRLFTIKSGPDVTTALTAYRQMYRDGRRNVFLTLGQRNQKRRMSKRGLYLWLSVCKRRRTAGGLDSQHLKTGLGLWGTPQNIKVRCNKCTPAWGKRRAGGLLRRDGVSKHTSALTLEQSLVWTLSFLCSIATEGSQNQSVTLRIIILIKHGHKQHQNTLQALVVQRRLSPRVESTRIRRSAK